MNSWKNILNYVKRNSVFLLNCIFCTVSLFFIMRAETPCTDAVLCIVTTVIVAKSYKRQKRMKKRREKLCEISDYLEEVRHEITSAYPEGILCDVVDEKYAGYYYRIICVLKDMYNTLGCRDTAGFMDILGTLQEAVAKDCDKEKNTRRELAGLKWIILLAIPALPVVRAWVVANIGDMAAFYNGIGGILLKYGIWIFALHIFIFFDRLEEMKSEKYI